MRKNKSLARLYGVSIAVVVVGLMSFMNPVNFRLWAAAAHPDIDIRNQYDDPYMHSIELNHATNQIVIIFRQNPSVYWTSDRPPDIVWKEIYGVVDGKIKLIKKIEGTHIPESTTVTPERLEFDE